ncbi:MAG: FMN-binding negative transcriptional regulator [Thermomicrobiales bacterium]
MVEAKSDLRTLDFIHMVYLPPHFIESDSSAIYGLIEANPLGMLITMGSQGITANPIPCVLDRDWGEQGRLLLHVARNNPVWRDVDPGLEALVVFQSVDRYITPNWYPSKQTTHEVVPTWNYAMAQVRGELIVHDDERWVRGQAGKLTKMMEASEPVPWKMADAPRKYTEDMLANIVGIEIPIRSLIGKTKASQNRLPEDAAGAVAGLRARGSDADLAMAALIERSRPTH